MPSTWTVLYKLIHPIVILSLLTGMDTPIFYTRNYIKLLTIIGHYCMNSPLYQKDLNLLIRSSFVRFNSIPAKHWYGLGTWISNGRSEVYWECRIAADYGWSWGELGGEAGRRCCLDQFMYIGWVIQRIMVSGRRNVGWLWRCSSPILKLFS